MTAQSRRKSNLLMAKGLRRTRNFGFSMNQLEEIGALYLAETQSLKAFIRGLVRQSGAAEDISQEVWLKLLEAIEGGEVIQDRVKWCRAVARNLILHYWREQQRQRVIFDSELLELADQAFASLDTTSDYWIHRKEALTQCLCQLPERSRTLLKLKYADGFSSEIVGKCLDQSPASVLMALSRVRRALGQCIERRLKTLSP